MTVDKPMHEVMYECAQAVYEAGKKSVPARMMYEVGVEGDRFYLHAENDHCKEAGCVPA